MIPFKTALITGGSGFVGRHLARELFAAGTVLTNIDLRPPTEPHLFRRSIIGDIRNPAAVAEAVRDVEVVIHLAAAHHDNGIDATTYETVNVGGTKTLCAACDEAGVDTIAFTSTVAVYGTESVRLTEEDDPQPATPYGKTKLGAERALTAWGQGLATRRLLILRPAVVFGPENFANMFNLVRQIESRRFIPVGSGKNVKSMIYIDNLTSALLYLLYRLNNGEQAIVNAADKPDMTSSDIIGRIYASLGRTHPRLHLPLALACALAAPFDAFSALSGMDIGISRKRVRKLADATTRYPAVRLGQSGFQQEILLPEGISRMVEWYVEHGKTAVPYISRPPREIVPEIEML